MKKRQGAEQIVAMLRQADVWLGKGLRAPEVCEHLGISEPTYCRGRLRGARRRPGGRAALAETVNRWHDGPTLGDAR